MFGRNGDCPCVVLAPQSPADCFDIAIEAARIALQHMVPVILLSDGYLANGSEPWPVPNASDFDRIEINHPHAYAERGFTSKASGTGTPGGKTSGGGTDDADLNSAASNGFQPYARDENLTRPWALPGTPGYEHRLGGLEKQNITGNVSYDPQNHQDMTELRAAKVAKVADTLPDLEINGDASGGDLLVLGWGGPYGSITTAVNNCQAKGMNVSSAQLRHLNPFPRNLGEVLGKFEKVLIPELNTGQLRLLINGQFNINAKGLNKIQGKPFLVEEIERSIESILD
jgi:2-oxoglutarate ferredoxin oxidoreductase subunit alpha